MGRFKASVRITLTGAERWLLNGAKHLTLTQKGSFVPGEGAMTSIIRTMNVKY